MHDFEEPQISRRIAMLRMTTRTSSCWAHRGDHGAVRNGLTVVLAKYRPGASILASSRPSVKRSAVACARARRVLATAARPGRVSASTPEPLGASTNGRDKVPTGAVVSGAS
jgi:hypothetical protein